MSTLFVTFFGVYVPVAMISALIQLRIIIEKHGKILKPNAFNIMVFFIRSFLWPIGWIIPYDIES